MRFLPFVVGFGQENGNTTHWMLVHQSDFGDFLLGRLWGKGEVGIQILTVDIEQQGLSRYL